MTAVLLSDDDAFELVDEVLSLSVPSVGDDSSLFWGNGAIGLVDEVLSLSVPNLGNPFSSKVTGLSEDDPIFHFLQV